MNRTFLVICIVYGILLLAYSLYRSRRRKQRLHTMQALDMEKRKNTKNALYFLYRIYIVTPILKRYFGKLKNRIRVIYPTDEITLNYMITKRLTLTLAISVATFIGVCAMGKGELPYIIVGSLIFYILFTNLVNKTERNMQYKLLEQHDTFISDVHANFHDFGMPDEAISTAIDDLPHEISLHANIILDILKNPEPELALEAYTDSAPNKYLLLMAAICSSINEYGDKVLEDGRSLFLKNLNFLKEELNRERLRIKKEEFIYSGKVFAVLAPLFATKIAEWVFGGMLPETASYFQGSGGFLSLSIISAITFVCYEVINILRDARTEYVKEDKPYKTIAKIGIVNKYLTLYTEHNYTKARRTADYLKSTGDKSGLFVFMIKRITLALALFACTNLVWFTAINKDKNAILTDFTDVYAQTVVPSEDYREELTQATINQIALIKKDISSDTMYEYALSYTNDEKMATIIAGELMTRKDAYDALYYKWWQLLVAIGIGVVGYFIPYGLLRFKKSVMESNREDEVGQFRTLILILMHQDGMKIDTVLEWMERFAHAFKSSIADCIISLESSQQNAIEKMRDEESGFSPFRRLCDSLLAVDRVGLVGAFDSLETDRDYYQAKRAQDDEELMRKNATLASRLAMIPVWGVVILHVIVPIGISVMTKFSQFDF